jgi:hypothetical protein
LNLEEQTGPTRAKTTARDANGKKSAKKSTRNTKTYPLKFVSKSTSLNSKSSLNALNSVSSA